MTFECLFVTLGAQKLARIRENSNFFRSELQKMGFEVLGDNDSPVMPIMLYNPAKIPAFSRECLKQNVSDLMFFFFCYFRVDHGFIYFLCRYVIFYLLNHLIVLVVAANY